MSQKTVQWLIGRLLTDEDYRAQFLGDPLATLVAMRDQGFELTRAEMEALLRTERAFWSEGADRLDAHLQGCSLRRG